MCGHLEDARRSAGRAPCVLNLRSSQLYISSSVILQKQTLRGGLGVLRHSLDVVAK